MSRRPPTTLAVPNRRAAPSIAVVTLAVYVVFGSRTAALAQEARGTDGSQDGPAQQKTSARPVVRFDIPPGRLDDVLVAFEQVTGVRVRWASDALRDLHSPGISGLLTPEQALEQAVRGTGVAVQFGPGDTVSIDVRTGERVDVLARASVVSPKFTEPLVDTPQSISVIPAELFNQQGAQNLTDVLRNTPGITFNAGENGFVSGLSNFSLRGFDSTGSVFIDGTRDSGNYLRDVFNVEQVEVVKGPAGDNGRTSAGGYVNLATKNPLATSFQRASVTYGSDERDSRDRGRVALDVNQQLNAGTAIRLNALWQGGGMPGREHVEMNSWGVAPSIGLGLNGATRAVVSYQHVEHDDVPDWGVPGALLDGMITYNPAGGGENNRANFYGHTSDYDDVTTDVALARIEHDFSSTLTLTNTTRWASTDREALYTVPTGYAPATNLATTQRQGYRRDNTTLTNLTNLSATARTGGLHHAIATGLELTREESAAGRYPTNGVLGNPGSTPIGRPDPNRALAGLVGLVPSETSDVNVDTIAAYAYDTVHITSHWQVTGGLRLERYDVDIDSETAAGASQGPNGYDRTDTTVSGKVGVVYKPTAAGSIYGAVGTAALPPASYLSNPDISREGDNAFPGWAAGQNSATSKVQRSTNYELGTKWSVFNQGLSLAAALFRTERSNIAMAGTVDGVPNTFAGYATQVVQGVELSVAGNITPALTVFGGALFMDSERRHSAAVDAARAAANPADYGTKTTTNGDQLAFTPNVTANLWTTYRLPFRLTIGGGLRYVGDSYLGRPDDAERIIPNGNAGQLPAYTVIDAIATFEVNRHLTLRFNANNLTDEFYAAAANWAGSRITVGPARSFLLSTDISF